MPNSLEKFTKIPKVTNMQTIDVPKTDNAPAETDRTSSTP